MDVCPLVIHVLDAVLGGIVLYPRSRQLAAAPVRLASGEIRARRCLSQHPPIVFSAKAVVMEAIAAGLAILRQFGKAGPKTRVDIALERLGGWADVGVGVIDLE